MDMQTLQDALKELYYSLGGSADAVRGVEDINAIIMAVAAVAALALGDKISAAAELPALPDDDGTYALQLVMSDGAATFTWEAAGE